MLKVILYVFFPCNSTLWSFQSFPEMSLIIVAVDMSVSRSFSPYASKQYLQRNIVIVIVSLGFCFNLKPKSVASVLFLFHNSRNVEKGTCTDSMLVVHRMIELSKDLIDICCFTHFDNPFNSKGNCTRWRV